MNKLHVILAALRCYQTQIGQRHAINEIATNGGEQPLPTEEYIDTLCEDLNCGVIDLVPASTPATPALPQAPFVFQAPA